MSRICHILAATALSLTLSPLSASASPIVQIFTDPSALLALYPSGTDPVDITIALEEFHDSVLDSGLTVVGGNGTLTNSSGGSGGGYWSTTGSFSFQLSSGSAGGLILLYQPLLAGQPVPSVSMTLVNGSSFNVGPLVGGSTNGNLFFGFVSSQPFTAVSLGLASGALFITDVAGFIAAPTPIPEPSTFALLATGLLLSRRRLKRIAQREKRSQA
jgi:hypothetical protein